MIKTVKFLSSFFIISSIFLILGVIILLFKYSSDLPDYKQLANYNPPTTTRLYSSEGDLIKEYATQRRLFIPESSMPRKLKNAFIAAEDKNFYTHNGIDFGSILKATIKNIINIGSNRPLIGGSTITQQVVKNLLLTNERSLDRKIREAILSFRISKSFSKEKILELYLNEIYLGNRSYGVAAAALNYFNKSVDELNIQESALLAALPKAPSKLDPFKNIDEALDRRNWVLKRMYQENFISEDEYLAAKNEPISLKRYTTKIIDAEYFNEEVRRKLEQRFGKNLYQGGLTVNTTLDKKYQDIAHNSLVRGLREYDKRHGYRGPIAKIDINNWHEKLNKISEPENIYEWQLAVILEINNNSVRIGTKEEISDLFLKNFKWAREYISENQRGPSIKHPSDVFKIGDIILVSKKGEYYLEQIPQVNGAIIVMNPHNGRIYALSGGYGNSQFNRATQAYRQPGSAFKPFVYLTALENNYTPSSIIIDEEIQLEQGGDQPSWKPINYSGRYYGPTTLRTGLEKSRNAMTVRLSDSLGIRKILSIAKKFNIFDNPKQNLSLALGSGETTLMKLTTAYAMIANGGKEIKPSLIETIQNRNGRIIFRRDNRICDYCNNLDPSKVSLFPPEIQDNRKQVIDQLSAYQLTWMLKGVIDRGTAISARSLRRNLAGKTGTTNNSIDSWFIGFSADLVAGVYVGFDQPKTLGNQETGSSVALPIWRYFMSKALSNNPNIPFRRPDGIKLVKIDRETGLLPTPSTKNYIFEAFKPGTEPKTYSVINDEDGLY